MRQANNKKHAIYENLVPNFACFSLMRGRNKKRQKKFIWRIILEKATYTFLQRATFKNITLPIPNTTEKFHKKTKNRKKSLQISIRQTSSMDFK